MSMLLILVAIIFFDKSTSEYFLNCPKIYKMTWFKKKLIDQQ